MDTRLTGNLNGKVAYVTGGTGVLGQALVRTLSRHGCAVAIGSRTQEKADAAAEVIQERGGKAVGIALDVTDRSSVENAAAQAAEKLGPADILVNAAGGNIPEATAMEPNDFFGLPPEALHEVTNLNLIGTILPSQIIGEEMAHAGKGVIVNISSMTASRPLTRVLGYGASKAAIDNFTKWLAAHMAMNFSPDIRVNAIAPGFFETDQNRFLLRDNDDNLTDRGELILEHTPMGRFGEPDDLDGTLIWLVSDMSRFVTGTVIPVDGGFSAFSGV